MVDIFNEILWPQYKKLDKVRNLTEQQQADSYRHYLNELASERIRYSHYANRLHMSNGGKKLTQEEEEFILLQENNFSLLQENGSNINIT